MTAQREFFTDTVSGDLTYVGDGPTIDADVDPSDAETVTRDDHWVDFFGTDEFVEFKATVAKPLVQPYLYNDTLHKFRKTTSELKQAQAQIDNLPWTMGHPAQKRVTDASQIRGVWSEPRWEDGQVATLHIPADDPEAVRFAVTNDEVSPGFGGRLDWADDDTASYDATQRDMAYDHIASVENGRCSPEDGCGLHTDSATQHGHTVLTDVDLPSYTEGDVVGHRLFPEFVGVVEHNPDNPEIVMVSALDDSDDSDDMMKTGHTITAGPSDLLPMDDMDVQMVDSLQTPMSEEDGAHEAYEDITAHQYETKEEALIAAREMGCDDVHTHETDDGNTVYMPCVSMQKFEQVVDVTDADVDSNESPTDAMSNRSRDDADCDGLCHCGCHDGPYYDEAPSGIHMSDGSWYGVAPDETADDEAKYELNNCNDVTDAYNLRNNGDYDIETETLVTRIKRAADAHDCPRDNRPWVADSDESAIETASDTSRDIDSAQSDNQSEQSETTMTDSLTDFLDEQDLDATDVIDALDVDVPQEPTAFYDGEPDIDTLADDFDAVDLLIDEKQAIESERDSLRENLREAKRPVFADKAEELASKTQKWGDEDDLMAKFDAEDDDERWTVDDIDAKLELVEDIIDESTTMITDSGEDADNADTQSAPDIDTTASGGFDLRTHTKVE